MIFLADDMGWGDWSRTGSPAFTPNLDAMSRSKHAVWFQRAYSGAEVPIRLHACPGDCSPPWTPIDPMDRAPYPPQFQVAPLICRAMPQNY